jgi:hypothetical protein
MPALPLLPGSAKAHERRHLVTFANGPDHSPVQLGDKKLTWISGPSFAPTGRATPGDVKLE